jgi:hypothetical protein
MVVKYPPPTPFKHHWHPFVILCCRRLLLLEELGQSVLVVLVVLIAVGAGLLVLVPVAVPIELMGIAVQARVCVVPDR